MASAVNDRNALYFDHMSTFELATLLFRAVMPSLALVLAVVMCLSH